MWSCRGPALFNILTEKHSWKTGQEMLRVKTESKRETLEERIDMAQRQSDHWNQLATPLINLATSEMALSLSLAARSM